MAPIPLPAVFPESNSTASIGSGSHDVRSVSTLCGAFGKSNDASISMNEDAAAHPDADWRMSPRVPRPEASDTIVALTAATPFGITAVARIASGMTNRCNPPPTLPIHSHTRRRPRVPCTLSVAELNPRSKSGVSAPLPPRKCGVYAPLVPRTRPFASPRVDVVGGARHACAHVTVSATPPRNSTSFSGGDELPGGNKRSSIVVARSSGLRATTSDGGSPASVGRLHNKRSASPH
mmetsp:Transcript_19941/g.60508  ORF Transcript_19941/g.60508 Transcript_19941/m.60508 type:complete len:235 (-) Transcript_19941:521-1225(-)